MITADLLFFKVIMITFNYIRLLQIFSLIIANIMYHKQEVCACQQCISLLIIKYHETYI